MQFAHDHQKMPSLRIIKQKLESIRRRIQQFTTSILVRLHLRKNQELLSYFIDEWKKESQKGMEKRSSLILRLWKKLDLVLFSKFETGLVFVIACMFIFWFMPFNEWIGFFALLEEDFTDFFLVLWQVQASMLGLTFVIVMFLVTNLMAKIESTYEKVSGRIIHEFLNASKISLILPFCLASIVYIGISILFVDVGQTYQNLALFILNIASIFYLFYTAFNFFKPRALEKLRLMHLKDAITKSVDAEISRRLSENVLLKLNDSFVKYDKFGFFDKSSLTAITSTITEKRMVSDINVSKLLTNSKICPITVVKSIGSVLSKDNNVLCYVPNGADPNVRQAIRNCFVLDKVSEEVELIDALDGVQEETREAIRTGNISKLDRVLDVYLSLLESFLKQTSAYDIHFDSKTARSMFVFGWNPILRIIISFEQMVDYAFKQGDLETLRRTVYFPTRVANLAIQYGDHFLFQRFISLFYFIYFLGSKAVDPRIANFAADRSWRYLVTISRHVRRLLEDSTEVVRVDNLEEYVIEILLAFNRLLKNALDNKDSENFAKIGFALDGILKYFEPSPSLFKMEIKLATPELTPEEKNEIDRQLKAKRRLVEVKEKVEKTKKCMWFGLGAWNTRLYRRQGITQSEFLTFFSNISKRFDNLEKLSSTFGLLTRFSGLKFGWDSWVLAEKPEGEVFGIDTLEWMQWFYCLQGIRLTPTSIGEGTPILPSRIIVDTFESMKQLCNKVLENAEIWERVLGEEIKKKTSNFLLLNQRASAKQIENEKQWLVDQELSTRLLEDFTNKVVEEWKSSATVGAVIKLLGNSVDLDSNGKYKNIKHMGINVLSEKAAFVEGWHVGYPGLGEAFGRSLGKGENGLLLKEICSSLKLHKKLERNKICEGIYSAIMKLNELRFKPSVIFIRDWEALTYLLKSERFKQKSSELSSKIGVVDCRGYFEGIPVFFLHECPIDCCVVDIARLGVLNRCKLTSSSEPHLEISIVQITDAVARSMIKKNPNLLKDEKGKDKALEVAIFDLKQKVHLKILEKVRFEIQESNAGLRLEFEN